MIGIDTNILLYSPSPVSTFQSAAAEFLNAAFNDQSRIKLAHRKIFDVKLVFTLQHHEVVEFATTNVKDSQKLGFEHIWNPVAR